MGTPATMSRRCLIQGKRTMRTLLSLAAVLIVGLLPAAPPLSEPDSGPEVVYVATTPQVAKTYVERMTYSAFHDTVLANVSVRRLAVFQKMKEEECRTWLASRLEVRVVGKSSRLRVRLV